MENITKASPIISVKDTKNFIVSLPRPQDEDLREVFEKLAENMVGFMISAYTLGVTKDDKEIALESIEGAIEYIQKASMDNLDFVKEE